MTTTSRVCWICKDPLQHGQGRGWYYSGKLFNRWYGFQVPEDQNSWHGAICLDCRNCLSILTGRTQSQGWMDT